MAGGRRELTFRLMCGLSQGLRFLANLFGVRVLRLLEDSPSLFPGFAGGVEVAGSVCVSSAEVTDRSGPGMPELARAGRDAEGVAGCSSSRALRRGGGCRGATGGQRPGSSCRTSDVAAGTCTRHEPGVACTSQVTGHRCLPAGAQVVGLAAGPGARPVKNGPAAVLPHYVRTKRVRALGWHGQS